MANVLGSNVYVTVHTLFKSTKFFYRYKSVVTCM